MNILAAKAVLFTKASIVCLNRSTVGNGFLFHFRLHRDCQRRQPPAAPRSPRLTRRRKCRYCRPAACKPSRRRGEISGCPPVLSGKNEALASHAEACDGNISDPTTVACVTEPS